MWLVFAAMLLGSSACSAQRALPVVRTTDFDAHPILGRAFVGVSIYDVEQDKFVVEHHANKRFVPASNTKLLTTYASMKYLPAQLPGWFVRETSDTLFLKPNGDPTLFHPEFEHQPIRAYLASETRPVVIELERETEFSTLGSGWSWTALRGRSFPRRSQLPMYASTHPLQRQLDDAAGGLEVVNFGLFADTLQNEFPQLRLSCQWIDSVPLADYVPLYTYPTDEILSIMMKRSDNFMAEQLLLMVGTAQTGRLADRPTASRLLKEDLGNLPHKPSWADGSGLSRNNLFSPRFFVELLRLMEAEFGWERVTAILPHGNQGTLEGLYQGYEDRIFAKTGTLNTTLALSGYLITKRDRKLVFSFLVNNQEASAPQVRKAIEEYLIGLIEGY